MTGNTIKQYDETISTVESLLTEASDTERFIIESAINSIKEAKLQVISEKKEAADTLYESGNIDENEYNEYMEYVNNSEFSTEADLLPYMATASISAALTLGESEKTAYNSDRCKHLVALENGRELSPRDSKFLKSRLSKYLLLCEESEYSDKWNEDIDEGYMTESLHDFINTGKKIWDKEYVKYEHAAKDYISEVINKKGDSQFITEQVEEALVNGYISPVIADKMKKMIAISDIKSTL